VTSRSINDLHPLLQPMAHQFLTNCAARWGGTPVAVIITSTWRSGEEQHELWRQGREIPGPVCRCGGKANPIGTCPKHLMGLVVTKADAGQSKHNFVDAAGKPASLAFDSAILLHGKAIWGTKGDGIDDNPADDFTDELELWQRMGAIGMDLGLDWFGAPKAPFREFPHMQHPLAAAIMAGRG
jgi:peptidoglycan L-alanyl-D-glutamate endopeptidase CwlK